MAFRRRVRKRIVNEISYTSAKKKFQRDEHTEQVYLCQWLRSRSILFCSIPNGAPITGSQRAWMVAEGLTAGAPDLLIFNKPNKAYDTYDVKGKKVKVLHCGIALEMKVVSGGVQSDVQKKWEKELNELGWIYLLCKGCEDAVNKLTALGYDSL